jgi:hypothetical protein
LESIEVERNWFFTDLYFRLPFSLANILKQIYYKFGIGVKSWPLDRNYERTVKQSYIEW